MSKIRHETLGIFDLPLVLHIPWKQKTILEGYLQRIAQENPIFWKLPLEDIFWSSGLQTMILIVSMVEHSLLFRIYKKFKKNRR